MKTIVAASLLIHLTALIVGFRLDEWPIVFSLPLIACIFYGFKENKQDLVWQVLLDKRVLLLVGFVQLIGWLGVLFSFYFSFEWGFDTLSFSQGVSYFVHKGKYYNTSLNINSLCDHFTPSLLLFAPLFKMCQTGIWLLLMRWIAYAASCYILFLIAQKYQLPKGSIAIVLLTYLIYYPTSVIMSYDFHPSNLSLFIMPFTFYLWLSKRWVFWGITMVFSILLKENMAIMLCVQGTYVLLHEKKKYIGVIQIGVGFLASYSIFYYFTPLISGCENFHHNYMGLFSNIPNKLEMVLNLLLGVGLIPIFNWKGMAMFLVSLSLSFISKINELASIGYHYHDIATGTLFIVLIGSLALYQEGTVPFEKNPTFKKWLACLSLVVIILYNKLFATWDIVRHWPNKENMELNAAIKNAIPQLDKGRHVWVLNSLALHFLEMPELNSIQPLRSLSTYEAIYQDSAYAHQYIILGDFANQWPLYEQSDKMKAELLSRSNAGEYIFRKEFLPLYVFERAK